MAKPSRNSKPPIPPATPPHSPDQAAPRQPLWETLAMGAAFVLLWLWFGAHKSAQNTRSDLNPAWTAALLIALAAMAFITLRRVQRFKSALEETQRQARRGPHLPWMPPDRNGRN